MYTILFLSSDSSLRERLSQMAFETGRHRGERESKRNNPEVIHRANVIRVDGSCLLSEHSAQKPSLEDTARYCLKKETRQF